MIDVYHEVSAQLFRVLSLLKIDPEECLYQRWQIREELRERRSLTDMIE